MTQEPRPELHLMVLWENARSHEQEILADLPQHITILRAFDMGWTPERVQENYTRFYGVKLDSASGKAAECGGGRFLLLVLRDEHPQYGMAETSRGHERLNLNLFNLKKKYRSLMGGKSLLHATNSVQETNHDATLLLGLNYEDLAAAYTTPWDGSITRMERDITGAGGQWESAQQLFYTLNATEEYVVLRGLEVLQQPAENAEHGDIDIMVRHYGNAATLVGGEAYTPNGRPHYRVNIGGHTVCLDLWDIRNGYHDAAWDEDIIRTYELQDKLIRVPRLENYFYIMVYHCLVNKRKIAADYPALLESLFRRLGLDAQHRLADYTSPFDLYYRLLHDFMQRMHYRFTRPKDSAVFFCKRTTEIEEVTREFERRYGWQNIVPVHCEALGHGSNLFLSAEEPNGQGRIFIKHGKSGGIYKNEYMRAKELYALAPQNVVEPLYWRDSRDFHFAAARWTEGETLEDLLEGGTLTTEQKAAFLEDILSIFLALQQSDIVHRDLIPRNLLYTGGHLKLIDFQFAVSKNHYEELKFFCVPKRYKALCALGKLPADRRCIWDDAYALERIIRAIGSEPAYAERYESILNQVSAAVGKHAVVHAERETVIYYAKHGCMPPPPPPPAKKPGIGKKLRRFFTFK